MLTLKIGEKELNVKYGYKPTIKSGIIRKLTSMSNADDSSIDAMEYIMLLLPEMLLVGVQKYHRDEYGYNYDTGEGKEEQMEKMFDLLDDYFDKDDADFSKLFKDLQDEMVENSFLASLFREEKEKSKNATETEQEKN